MKITIEKWRLLGLLLMTGFAFVACSDDDDRAAVTPSIVTGIVEDIAYTSAKCYGTNKDITTIGAIEYGICYSATEKNPTVDNNSEIIPCTINESGVFFAALSGLSPGTIYYYRAYLKLATGYVYGEVKSFTTQKLSYQAVDLGLSVKWATFNVGAAFPEDYGGYYAWGETEEKSDYSEGGYKYYKNDDYIDIGTDISGSSYDVARTKWGDNWRMPTHAEQEELMNSCTWTWTTLNGVNGMKVTGSNGNSIFLPAAGCRFSESVYYRGTYGVYWSASLLDGRTYYAWIVYFDDDGRYYWDDYLRCYGFSVRPVLE